MSINKSDCMDCGLMEIGTVRDGDKIVSKVYICIKTGIMLGTGKYLDAMEDECPYFKYEE